MNWFLNQTYWRFRHWLWDKREHLFVREVARHMRMQCGTKLLYVHEYENERARWVVVPEDTLVEITADLEPHGHVEGPKK